MVKGMTTHFAVGTAGTAVPVCGVRKPASGAGGRTGVSTDAKFVTCRKCKADAGWQAEIARLYPLVTR